MSNDPFFPSATSTAGISFDEGLRVHMQRIFGLMAGGLGLTGVIAYLVSSMQLIALLQSPLIFLFMLAPLGIVMYMSLRLRTAALSTLYTMFWLYCGLMGVAMASIFLIYTKTSIAHAFFISAGMFGGMALWGYTTKRDLTSMGSFLMMGVLGLVIAGVVNMFLMSPMLYWVSSVLGVVIFTGLTAYDAQSIKQNYAAGWGRDANDRMAIMGALRLYMDFINMFMSLLRLTGRRN